MVAKLSFSDFLKRVQSQNGDALVVREANFNGAKAAIVAYCRIHDQHIAVRTAASLFEGNPCSRCRSDAKLRRYDAKVREALRQSYPQFDLLFETVIGFNISVPLRCPKHGVINANTDALIFRRFGCSKCGREVTGVKNRGSSRVSFDQFAKRFKKRFGDKLILTSTKEDYINFQSEVTVKCNHPDHPGDSKKAINWLKNNGCTACNESVGERRTRLALEDLGIRFEQEKRFATCRDRKELPFDFWLPDHAVLIEFHGAQHSIPADRFGGDDALHGTKRRDAIKEKWASENRIALVKLHHVRDIKPTILGALKPHQDFDPKRILADLDAKEAENISRRWTDYRDRLQAAFPSYDFSASNWQPGTRKIEYLCPDHGVREGNLQSLLKGHGCPLCARNVVEFDEFVRRSQSQFGGKFDFSSSNFTSMQAPITFRCPAHGEVTLTPNQHLRHQNGCSACSNKASNGSPRKFLERAHKKFGDRFDYSNLEYVDASTPVTVMCREHKRTFTARPWDHLSTESTGCCPDCVMSQKRRTHSKSITVEGQVFPSFKEAAVAYALRPTTVRKRLKDGWDVDAAFTTSLVADGTSMKKVTVVGLLTFSSFSDAASHFGISEAAVRARLKLKWSIEDAFTRPLRTSSQKLSNSDT